MSSQAWGDQSPEPTETEKTNKNEDNETVRGNPLHDLPEWLQEFTENLVDESVSSSQRRTASSFRESASGPRGKVVSGKHCIYTHFPKDRNCHICMRTKITRTPCRKRTGAAVLRAEHFGDLITADHKVLSEGCESRNNHRHSVVVKDLATQWIQSHPCKTKTSQETERILWTLANPLKTDHGIIGLLHTIDPRQVVLRRERFAEQKKERLLYCCNQVWMKSGGRIPWSAIAICETFKISCLMGRHLTRDGSEYHLMAWLLHLEGWLNITLFLLKYLSRLHQFGKKVLPGIFLGHVKYAGENLERRHLGRRHWGIGIDGRI